MNNFFSTLIELFQGLLGGSKVSASTPTTDEGTGGGDNMALSSNTDPITSKSHALVLPDQDFRSWYEATTGYTAHFGNVIIARSPAGNNLNRYRVVSAVTAKRVWFNDDPVGHIRRAYPSVVTVDLISATTPTELKSVLDARVRNNQRYGTAANQNTRFVLDWPTDSFSLQIIREFDVDMGNGKYHEGVDIDADPGVAVRAAASGTVFNVIADPDILGYGKYVQIRTIATDGNEYLVTYTQLQNIQVQIGQAVKVGDQIGACASDWGIKLVVQQAGHTTGNRYTMPGAIDPVKLFYVDGMQLHTTATSGLNIRKGQGTEYERVGSMAPEDTARTLELHGLTIRKTQTAPEDGKWINIDTSKGVTGYGAAWFLQARSPRSAIPGNLGFNGVNLDPLHPLGKPDPSRLGNITYVRLPYSVSMGRGSQDLNAAYNVYAPYIDQLARAGKKIIMVYTHQTYGEGAGFVWEQMTPNKWRELGARFADFLRVIVGQYRDRGVIVAHQIWNEQDAPIGAEASVRMSSSDYAGLLTTAIQAIRSVDPSTPIITGGHTGGPGDGVRYAKETIAAMPSTLRPDGIAAHPYGRGTDVNSKYARFGHINETVREYGTVMPGKRIWITEWGILNAPNESPSEVNSYATSFVTHLKSQYADKVAATVWYAWADSMHNGYGLVNQSNQPKEPLYSSLLGIR